MTLEPMVTRSNIKTHIKTQGLLQRLWQGVSLSLALICVGAPVLAADTSFIPDNQKASVTISGSGAAPRSEIALSTGPAQKLVAVADAAGNFVFSNLGYYSFSNLNFSLDIPASSAGVVKNAPVNHLTFGFDPTGAMATIKGYIGKSGTIAFHMKDASDSAVRVAGQEGYVELFASPKTGLASGQSMLAASIINVGEVCCPRLIVPAPPINLMISSTPVVAQNTPPVVPQTKSLSRPAVPYMAPKSDPESPPQSPAVDPETPADKSVPPQDAPAKKKVPYIVQGQIETDKRIINTDDLAVAVSFPSSSFESTYVGGEKKMTDEMRNTNQLYLGSLGAFLDARTFLDTLRSLQISAVETLKNYTASDSLCRFGTLSQSLAASSDVVQVNKLAFSKIMADRNNQVEGTLHADDTLSAIAITNDFSQKYCDSSDGFLEAYCKPATTSSDAIYNRDVDFTRVFDVPLTLDADFSDKNSTNDKQAVIALFRNLSLAAPYPTSNDNRFDPGANPEALKMARAINAARSVSGNSFAALVAEKTKATKASAANMQTVLVQLGLSSKDAAALIGSNPSYFAQMEIMTKKLFQDPAFYSNLYESEANVDRQRVAMKAIELQQERDLLESLRRREMLLSVLLNTKLERSSAWASQGSIVGKN